MANEQYKSGVTGRFAAGSDTRSALSGSSKRVGARSAHSGQFVELKPVTKPSSITSSTADRVVKEYITSRSK